MGQHLQRDIENVHRALLGLSSTVEEMIDKAARALNDRDENLAAEVIAMDETVDQAEVHIEEECLKMLALHQPVAIDLRRIATVMKVNNDLERMADLAVNIAERAQSLREYPSFPVSDDLNRMVNLTTSMVRGALDAFVNMDAQSARRIMRLDDDVDRYNCDIIAELQAQMQEQPHTIVPALFYFSVTRHVERIADHATNIAEDVVYLVEGEIVRHRHGAEV
jgi:phosphate transport system protein